MARDAVTVRVDSTLREVHALFARTQADVLPVVGRDESGWMRRVVGVVTRADLVRHLVGARTGRTLMLLKTRTAADVLRRVTLLKASEQLGAATLRLLEAGIAALPVVEPDGTMVGMLSLGDVLARPLSRSPLRSAS